MLEVRRNAIPGLRAPGRFGPQSRHSYVGPCVRAIEWPNLAQEHAQNYVHALAAGGGVVFPFLDFFPGRLPERLPGMQGNPLEGSSATLLGAGSRYLTLRLTPKPPTTRLNNVPPMAS